MIKVFKALIIIIFFSSITIHANSETSWITKKDDNKKKIVKETKKETSNWIKKKEVKENKKKLKEKINESKAWITKKSKEKVKDIKNNLKKHKNIDQLPKAEFYFTAYIEQDSKDEPIYVYGYIDPKKDSSSKNFKFKDETYSVLNDGIAYFENKKNRCEVNIKQNTQVGLFIRNIVLNCKKGFELTGTYAKNSSIGIADGEATGGKNVIFDFHDNKNKAIAKLEKYKDTEVLKNRSMLAEDKNIDLEPNGKYYALLIGNADYKKGIDGAKWASLSSPVKDINAISKILKNEYNFEKVTTLSNATSSQIFKALHDLSTITTENDYVLIYYSGHGEQETNQGYWIPINGSKKMVFGDWINVKDISVIIEKYIKAHHLVLMVDSCYTGTKFKGNNEIEKMSDNANRKNSYYKKLLEKRARYVLSSGGNEPVSDSEEGKHSTFALSFINALKNNTDVIRSGEIANRISLALSGEDQSPYLYSQDSWGHGGGDFIFIRK